MRTQSGRYEHLATDAQLAYDWDYEEKDEGLRNLRKKAQRSQWHVDDRLPWNLDVDLERMTMPESLHPLGGTDIYARLNKREKDQLTVELFLWKLSQFLHGEQGGLLAASQLVTCVPDMGIKLCAASQVVDESRHVEVFERYLREKVRLPQYEVSSHFKKIMDLTFSDARWDIKLLGTQIVAEGMILASASAMVNHAEPLIKEIVHFITLDEARHVAFGVLALRDLYVELSEAERHEREDYVYEVTSLMLRRFFLYDDVWEKVGLPVAECQRHTERAPAEHHFRFRLLSTVIPALKKIGLFSARLRQRFIDNGILAA